MNRRIFEPFARTATKVCRTQPCRSQIKSGCCRKFAARRLMTRRRSWIGCRKNLEADRNNKRCADSYAFVRVRFARRFKSCATRIFSCTPAATAGGGREVQRDSISPGFDYSAHFVILPRMTTTLSLRIKPSRVARIDARAEQLGFDDRSKYLLAVVEADLNRAETETASFRSEDLIGAVRINTGPATNKNTRRVIAAALKGRREKNR